MRRSPTIAAACERATIEFIHTGNAGHFDRWIDKLQKAVYAADWEYRRACDSVSEKRHAARFRRALTTARANLKAMEAAYVAACTARNRQLLEDDAVAKSA